MENLTIKEKQAYLANEIIKKGYDAQEFSIFLSEQKGEEKIDLEFWSMEDLQKAVESFKQQILLKKKEKEEKTKRHSSAEHTKNKNNSKEDYNHAKSGNLNKVKKIRATIVKSKTSLKIKNMLESDDDNDKDNSEEETPGKVKCVKLNKNEITDKDDLYTEIIFAEKNNKTISNSTEFIIETKPIGFKTKRKIYDFEYLSKKLSLINPEIYNPFLYINKSNSKEPGPNGTLLYLKLYLNALLQSSYFRSLSIVYDFLVLNMEEWEKTKVEKYDKIIEKNNKEKIPNLEGYFNLEMEAGDDEKCLNIKDEIIQKHEAFNKFNMLMDEFLKILDKISLNLKNISQSFGELKNRYFSNPNMINLLAHLEIIADVWADGYISRKKFFDEEFNYLFKYMDLENNSYIKYYNDFKLCYDEFKKKFDEMSKVIYPSKRDKKILKHLQKEFSFKTVNVYGEYQRLNDNQAKRIENKLYMISNNRNLVFKDIENIEGLLNFFKVKQINKANNNKNFDNKEDDKRPNE